MTLSNEMPDDVVLSFRCDRRTAIVALTPEELEDGPCCPVPKAFDWNVEFRICNLVDWKLTEVSFCTMVSSFS